MEVPIRRCEVARVFFFSLQEIEASYFHFIYVSHMTKDLPNLFQLFLHMPP